MTGQTPSQPVSSCLVRAYWAVFGPSIAIIALLVVATQSRSKSIVADLVFAALVGTCIAARLIDKIAAIPSKSRYAMILALAAASLWVAARALGPLVF